MLCSGRAGVVTPLSGATCIVHRVRIGLGCRSRLWCMVTGLRRLEANVLRLTNCVLPVLTLSNRMVIVGRTGLLVTNWLLVLGVTCYNLVLVRQLCNCVLGLMT